MPWLLRTQVPCAQQCTHCPARARAHLQVEGFPPKDQLKTVYVEHDIDGSLADMAAVEFIYADPVFTGMPKEEVRTGGEACVCVDGVRFGRLCVRGLPHCKPSCHSAAVACILRRLRCCTPWPWMAVHRAKRPCAHPPAAASYPPD